MNGKDILIGLGYVDEQFIHEAENKSLNKTRKLMKFAMPIAAGFAIVILSLALHQNGSNTPPINPKPSISSPTASDHSDVPTTEYKLKFNNVSMVSADKPAIKGHFWHELDLMQCTKILPVISKKYEVDGTVHYSSADGKATLYEVSTSVIVNETIRGNITISPNEIIKDCIVEGEPILSEIEGVKIEAGLAIIDKNSRGERNYIYYADFKMNNIDYYMEVVSENSEAEDVFTSMVADVILGGKADLSVFDNPAVPKIIDKELTETEAYNEADFGKYLIEIPSDYLFNGAYRWLDQTTNSLYTSWSKGYYHVIIRVFAQDEDSASRIVSPEQKELYDISLYPVPWVDSMPRDKYYTIENPVFRIEDLTLDMIKMRGHTNDEVDDPTGDSLNMQFSVLYDDVVVELMTEGLSAEYLFDKLTSLTIE